MMAEEISESDKHVLKVVFNPNMPVGEMQDEQQQNDDESTLDPVLLERAKSLEVKGIRHAEENRIDEALACFDQAIDILPGYAAGYNNRAQARRMKGMNQEAYDDLEKAITLSDSVGRTASLAFVQRALLHKLDGNNEKSFEDFKKAAALENDFAKQQVVQANPYAALCNQMLSDAIGKLSGKCEKE